MRWLRTTLLVFFVLATGVCRANHLVGMDMFYTHVSGYTYKVTLIAYANCGSAGSGSAYSALPTNTPAVHIYNGSSYLTTINLSIEPPSTGVEITPVCPADLLLTQCTNLSYTIPGIKKFTYSAYYTLPGTSSYWRFLFTGDLVGSSAGRATSITNISSTPVTSIQLESTLNNTTANNTNPVLSVIPTPFFCLNSDDNYNPGAVDPDGDALTFSLVAGIDGTTSTTPGTPVTYLGSFTPTAPLATSKFTFDNTTGQISFYPNALQRSLVVYNIEERRGGVLVGSCQREMTFLVLTCTNTAPHGGLYGATSGTIDDSTHFHVCQNSGAYSMYIDPTEPTKTNNIYVTASGIPTGASFSVTGNGTNAPHCTFSWTSTGITPGTYTFYITFTDDNCPLAGVQTLAYTITVLPVPTISYSSLSSVSCFQQAAVSLIPGGAGTPWVIKVDKGPSDTIQTLTGVTGPTIDSLPPGSFHATIFAAAPNGCSASVPITIAPPVPTPITATFTNPSFCGASDGLIKIGHLNPGETDTVRYLFNGIAQPSKAYVVAGDGTITIPGLLAGSYTSITASYGKYCTSTAVSATLTNPLFTMRMISFSNPVYCGICNGIIKLYGLHPAQTDTITYTLNGIAQPPVVQTIGTDSIVTIIGLCDGKYDNFIAKTAGACISNKLGPVTLTVPPFTQRALTYKSPSYCGVCDGEITIQGLHPAQFDTVNYTLGGVPQPPVTLYVGGDSAIKITGLCVGTYDNFYTNTGKCVSNKLGPLTLSAPPFTMRSVTYTNPDYCGICNGSVVIHGLHPGLIDTLTYTLGGIPQPPLTHLIAPDSLFTITGLCAGTYDNFIAKNGTSCISNKLGPVTLTVPPFSMRAITYTDPSYCGICNGTIKLYGLYPGQWDTLTYLYNGVLQTVSRFIGTDSAIYLTGLCDGVYDSFVARTAGVCVSNKLGPVTLKVPPFTMRTFSFTNPDYCGMCNGSIKLYGLFPGETDTFTYTLGGVLQPPVSGTIAWDSTFTITGLCDGAYDSIVATTGGKCVSNKLGPAVLTVPQFLMRDISYTNPDYCGVCNGTITLYGLHPGQTDTIYYRKNGIVQPPIIKLIATDSLVKITGLCDGVYDSFVAVTGGICISNILGPVTLTVPPFTMRDISHRDPDFCGICNGAITLYGLYPGQTDTVYFTKNGVPQSPVIYTVGTDSLVKITGLCAGLYDSFIARTGGVCVSNRLGPKDLVVPPFTMDRMTFTNPSKCGFCDGSVKLYGLFPGQTDTIYYQLNGSMQAPVSQVVASDSTITLTNLCEGVYDSFVAKTGGACISNALGPANLVAPPIKAGFLFDLRENCKADTLFFANTSTPASDLTYKWYFGDGDTSVLTDPTHIYYKPGVMSVKLVVTNTKCFDSVVQDIPLNNLMIVNFKMKPDSFVCQGYPDTMINLSEGTSLNYLWLFSDGTSDKQKDPVHYFNNTGTYQVMLTASNYVPCYDTMTKYLTVDSNSFVTMRATDTVLCNGHEVTFLADYQVQGLLDARWTFSDGTMLHDLKTIVRPFPDAGVFPVTLDVLYRACPDRSIQKDIVVFGYPQINLGPDTTICIGGFAIELADLINVKNPNARWEWSTGETTPAIIVTKPGLYYGTVFVYGCPTTDSVLVSNDCYMDIPNVFSPNGDGTNDYFFPHGILTRGVISFSMDIFNRWGQKIYESNCTTCKGWDGTFNGVPQPEGVFVYRISATFKDGQQESHTGNLTLIR